MEGVAWRFIDRKTMPDKAFVDCWCLEFGGSDFPGYVRDPDHLVRNWPRTGFVMSVLDYSDHFDVGYLTPASSVQIGSYTTLDEAKEQAELAALRVLLGEKP